MMLEGGYKRDMSMRSTDRARCGEGWTVQTAISGDACAGLGHAWQRPHGKGG